MGVLGLAVRERVGYRRRVRRLVREQGWRLCGGWLWVEGEVVRGWGVSVPGHVRVSKGLGRPLVGVVGWRWWMRLVGLVFVEGVVALVAGPPWVWNRRGVVGGAPVAVSTSVGGCLLVEAGGLWVVRVSDVAVFDAAYVSLRSCVSGYVGGPEFVVEDGGRLLREEFVVGEHLGVVDVGRRVACVRLLLRGLVGLVAEEGVGSSGDFVEGVWVRSGGVALPEGLRLVLGDAGVRGVVGGGPLVPSHGDLGEVNVLATGDGPVVIDWPAHRLGWRPFWFDGLNLLLRNMPGALVDRTFADELGLLWQAAGCDVQVLWDNLDAYAAAWALTRRAIRLDDNASAVEADRLLRNDWHRWSEVQLAALSPRG